MSTTRRDLRRFGFAFGGGLTVLGSLLLWREKAAAPWVLGAAVTVWLAAAVAPRALAPLERLLSRVFLAVTTALTYVILTIVFLLVVTPIGLVRRLLGKESLGLAPDPEIESYWVAVPPDGPGSRPDKPF